MDARVTAVLDAYHDRIREEREARAAGGPPAGGDWRDQALLAVGPDTGRLLNLLARSLDRPHILEIGTSFGYSGIWLAEAARAAGGRVRTLEMREHKSAYAREMATRAGLDAWIDFQVGDALELIARLAEGIDFVLVDLWKDLYEPCLRAVLPKLNRGAILVADNMLRPGGEGVLRYQAAVRAVPGMTSVLLPVGTGLELSRYEGNPEGNPAGN